MLVGELISLSASIFGLDPASTSLALNSQLLRPELTLATAGVVDSDLLLLGGGGGVGGGGVSGSMSGISGGGGVGGLNLIPPQLTRANSTPVEWAGMTLDDVFHNNRNPQHIVSIIRSHPNVGKKNISHDRCLFAFIFISRCFILTFFLSIFMSLHCPL